MPLKVERLRLAIVVLAMLVAAAVAGSYLYGRWRARRLPRDLPARLGSKIQQATKNFVLSKTEQGQPLFTLHASRALEYRSDGHFSLHDVEIDLYNGPGGEPDTIAGKNFSYDPHSQKIEAQGKAQIVLHLQRNGAAGQSQGGGRPASGPNKSIAAVVRVTTHDLTFDRKTGIAVCKGEVDFQMGGWSGQALGARYDSARGQLTLASHLTLGSHPAGQPGATLQASRAVYERGRNEIRLRQPRYRSKTRRGVTKVQAEESTLLLRTNGSPKQLTARNGVRLVSADGLTVRAPTMRVLFAGRNRLRQAAFSGGVVFTRKQPKGKGSGGARRVTIVFNDNGIAQRMVLDGGVRIHRQTKSKEGRLRRSLTAGRLTLDLASSRARHVTLQTAEANGDAVFTSEWRASGHPPRKTTMAAQTLTASFGPRNELRKVMGQGGTRLETVAANGDLDSSTGDTLQAHFESPAADAKRGPTEAGARLFTAVQSGHVVLRQEAQPSRPGASPLVQSTATADRARYTAAGNTLTLTGHPRFRNAQVELTAGRIAFDRATGKATANGTVRATLRAAIPRAKTPGTRTGGERSPGGLLGGGGEPVHIVAPRATVLRSAGKAIFSGGARLWRGGDAIEAPVIEISGKARTLKAYAKNPCKECVTATLVEQPAALPSSEKRKSTGKTSEAVFRILSHSLLYSDAERKVSFLGGVQATTSGGQLTSDRVDFVLGSGARRLVGVKAREQAAHPAGGASSLPPAVERMIASGHVRLRQPGRMAEGARLVYTAANGRFVLTGSPANPPRLTGASQGVVTGEKLTFSTRERAIMVTGTLGRRAAAQTRVQAR